jgi:hypothetical protein
MQLGHNLRVASQLDDVADQLAQQPLAVRHGSSRLLARAEKRRGPVGTIAGVVGGVWMAVSALRRYPRLADQLTTRRLYEQATGVDRDRANADLALVADRLSPLVSAPDGPQGDGPRVAWWRGWQPAGLQIGGCRPLRPRSPIGYRWPKTTTPIQRHSWTAWVLCRCWDAALRPTRKGHKRNLSGQHRSTDRRARRSVLTIRRARAARSGQSVRVQDAVAIDP